MSPIHWLKTTFLPLIKPPQTVLLVLTGVAGYMSARCPVSHWSTVLGVGGSLFLAVAGCTILNMVYDRDIDAVMQRTAKRPIASGELTPTKAWLLGGLLALVGVTWATVMAPLYGLVVLVGLVLDGFVYTVWLKRRTAWSVVWGGIAGGMPVLAGRVLGLGYIDMVGIMLALVVLLWIPTHILTFGIKHANDYRRAGVPVFANTHGVDATRRIIGLATVGSVLLMSGAALMMGMNAHCLWASLGLGCALLALTMLSVLRPSPQRTFSVFKFASFYMLGFMGLIILGV